MKTVDSLRDQRTSRFISGGMMMNALINWAVGVFGFAAAFGSIASDSKIAMSLRFVIFAAGAAAMGFAIFAIAPAGF